MWALFDRLGLGKLFRGSATQETEPAQKPFLYGEGVKPDMLMIGSNLQSPALHIVRNSPSDDPVSSHWLMSEENFQIEKLENATIIDLTEISGPQIDILKDRILNTHAGDTYIVTFIPAGWRERPDTLCDRMRLTPESSEAEWDIFTQRVRALAGGETPKLDRPLE